MNVVDGRGEFARFLEVGLGRFAPENIRVRGISNGAGDGSLQSSSHVVEAFNGALAGQEFAVARVNVAGEKIGAVGIGARHDQRGDAHHVGREPGGDQFLDCLRCGHQHFAAEVTTLLGR